MNNIYSLMQRLYDADSQYRRINNAIRVIYGYMTPQQMICDACKDKVIKHILFG